MKRYDIKSNSSWWTAPAEHGDWVQFTEAQAIVKPARKALESIAANTCCDKCQEAAFVARAALAALDAFGEGE